MQQLMAEFWQIPPLSFGSTSTEAINKRFYRPGLFQTKNTAYIVWNRGGGRSQLGTSSRLVRRMARLLLVRLQRRKIFRKGQCV